MSENVSGYPPADGALYADAQRASKQTVMHGANETGLRHRSDAFVVRVFGGVALSRGGEPVELGGGRQRRLLATLVATRGATLSADQLIDRVWSDGALPDDPRRSLHTYLTRLRQAFGDEPVLVTEPGGWRLDPFKVEVDRDQFEALLLRAHQPGVGAHERLGLLDDALRMANGRAFGDLDGLEWLRPEAERLEELRVTAIERRYDAMLEAGKHTDAVPGLAAEVEQHPLRDRLVGLQMLALHRSGRQAEAARVFQAHRDRQADLGLEPSAELVELDRRILASDPALAAAPAGQALRGYRLGEQLGEGAFAVVYRGTQPSVGRDVAVKIIRSELANRPEFIRRFEAEAHLVARLEHPHIVPLYDYWREPDRACLVFRYLRGGSLESRLTSGGPLSVDEAVTVVEQVGLALSVAHSAGVVHRDVKPANIFSDDVGNFYLGDFGIALEAANAAGLGIGAAAALSAGSPAYASPEQLKRQAVGPAADVHGFGISIYEALTARLPFPDAVNQADLLQRQMHDPIPPVRAQRTDVPNAVDAVLARATAKNPADRYQNVLDFVREFVAAAKPGSAGSKNGASASARGGSTLVSIGEERNPYKGLRAFSEADAGDFHGRERLVGRLVELFARNDTAGRIAAVVGPSGIGKSSVVRAGLLPALRRGAVIGSDQWFVATMLPGTDPFEELGAALLRVATSVPENMMGLLSADHRGITRVVKALVPEGSGAQILLVLDQFEELFTLVEDDQLRRRFLHGLEHALTDARCPLRVVLTIRADFWDRPLRHGTFARLIEHSTVNVTALAPDEIERAIVDPAESVGCRFEPGLVSEIVADVTDEPGALPLLQYALTELWERRVSGLLTRDAYREIGGVSGALARRAEELYVESGSDEQTEIRRIFGRLVTLGEGVEDTRRRVLRSELGGSALVDGVVGRFGSARLLSFDRDPVSREPTVEVAHEALIREWPRLRDWLDEDRDGLRVLRHVTESAASWVAAGRPESEVYRAGRLEAAEEFASSHLAELTPVEAEFVAAGVEARVREAAAEQERFEQQARSNRRLRRLLVGVGVALVVALLAGLLAFDQRAQARESAAAAEASAVAAETRRLIASSSSVVDENPEIALLLASEAYRREPGPAALAGLQRVLTSTDSYLGWLGVGTQYYGVSWVGDRVVGVSANVVDVFDPATREKVQSISFGDEADPDDPPFAQWGTARPPIAFSEDGNVVAVARSSRGVVLVNIVEEDVAELVNTSTVTALALDATGARVAVGDLDRDIAVYEPEGGLLAGALLSIEAFRERNFSDLPYADGYDLPSGEVTDFFDTRMRPIFFGNGVLDLVFVDDGSLASVSSGMVKVFGVDGSVTLSVAPTAVHPTAGRIPAPHTRVHEFKGLLRSIGLTGVTFHGAADGSDETVRLFTGRDDGNTVAVDSHSLSADLIVSVLNSGRLTVTPRGSEQVGRVVESNPVAIPADLVLSPDGAVAAVANAAGISLTALDGRQLLARAVPNQGRQLPGISFDGEQLMLSSLIPIGPAYRVDLQTGTTVEMAPDPDGNLVHNIEWLSPDILVSLTSTDAWAFLDAEQTPVRLPYFDFDNALSPDGGLLVLGRSVGLDGNDSPELKFVSLPGGKVLGTLDLGPSIGAAVIRRSVFSPDGKRLLTSFSDGRAVVIDPLTQMVIDELGPDANGVGGLTTMTFSADGKLLVTRDDAGSIDLRDPETFEIFDSLPGGVTTAEALGWDPYISADSRYVLTTKEQRPRLWDLEARMPIGTFPSDEGLVPDASAGADRLNLVTTLGDYAMVWNLNTDEWPEIACRAAGRNLTADEWEKFGPVDEPYRATCEEWPSALG